MLGEASFSKRLIKWQKCHGRNDLPWQKNATLYRVWVAEIMLQQTQVKTVVAYYKRFMRYFPNVRRLAEAKSDEVLAVWSGLGYYARARSLHQAAQRVCDKHKGRIPRDKEDLVALPGIGRSTAGAILSLACDQRHAILDANVRRVLARHADIAGWHGESQVKRKLWRLAEQRLPPHEVGRYNQALMDLGALVCTSKNPLCTACPVATDCQARINNTQDERPTSRASKPRTIREFSVLMVQHKHCVLLEQRPPSGVWGGLLSFPEASDINHAQAWCQRHFGRIIHQQIWQPLTYNLTHIQMKITPIRMHLATRPRRIAEDNRYIWCKINDPSGRISALVRRLLKQLEDAEHTDKDMRE